MQREPMSDFRASLAAILARPVADVIKAPATAEPPPPSKPVRFTCIEMPRPPRFDAEACVVAAKAGVPIDELARRYEVDPATVRRAICRLWPDRPPRLWHLARNKVRQITDAAVVAALQDTRQVLGASRRLGISETALRRILKAKPELRAALEQPTGQGEDER